MAIKISKKTAELNYELRLILAHSNNDQEGSAGVQANPSGQLAGQLESYRNILTVWVFNLSLFYCFSSALRIQVNIKYKINIEQNCLSKIHVKLQMKKLRTNKKV